jgi:hypothetical protein
MNRAEAFSWIAERKSWWPDMVKRGLHPENEEDCYAFVECLEARTQRLRWPDKQSVDLAEPIKPVLECIKPLADSCPELKCLYDAMVESEHRFHKILAVLITE